MPFHPIFVNPISIHNLTEIDDMFNSSTTRPIIIEHVSIVSSITSWFIIVIYTTTHNWYILLHITTIEWSAVMFWRNHIIMIINKILLVWSMLFLPWRFRFPELCPSNLGTLIPSFIHPTEFPTIDDGSKPTDQSRNLILEGFSNINM